jgi:dihydroxyacetone kinase-like predicted kinase
MSIKTLNGETFLSLLKAAARNLQANCQIVNDLNVFPVPDGDTGDNMLKTFQGGLESAIKKTGNNIGEVAKTFSQGALLGARGNSGVILSQFYKGFEEGLNLKEEVSATELNDAYKSGVEKAYHAVVKPVEGTILTVFKQA